MGGGGDERWFVPKNDAAGKGEEVGRVEGAARVYGVEGEQQGGERH
jgi:hypothetical protein